MIGIVIGKFLGDRLNQIIKPISIHFKVTNTVLDFRSIISFRLFCYLTRPSVFVAKEEGNWTTWSGAFGLFWNHYSVTRWKQLFVKIMMSFICFESEPLAEDTGRMSQKG